MEPSCKLVNSDFHSSLSAISNNSVNCIIYDHARDEPMRLEPDLTALIPKLTDDGTLYVFSHGRRPYISVDIGSNFVISNTKSNVYHISIWHFGYSLPGKNYIDGFDYIYACHKKGFKPLIYSPLPGVIEHEFELDGLTWNDFSLTFMIPIQVMSELILAVTQPGDLILDPCIGSGSTAIAAKQLKRNFIGFEINKQYFETAKKRFDRS